MITEDKKGLAAAEKAALVPEKEGRARPRRHSLYPGAKPIAAVKRRSTARPSPAFSPMWTKWASTR